MYNIELISFRCFFHDECNAYQYLNVEGINCILMFENETQNDSRTVPAGELAEVCKGQTLNFFDCLLMPHVNVPPLLNCHKISQDISVT